MDEETPRALSSELIACGLLKTTLLVLLVQVFAAGPDDEDDVLFAEMDEGEPMLKFDPCGHKVSVETFAQSVSVAVAGGPWPHTPAMCAGFKIVLPDYVCCDSCSCSCVLFTKKSQHR